MSEAPRWPGADGAPGLDFSSDRSASGATLYREGAASGGDSPKSPESAAAAEVGESESESTSVSIPADRTQSAVEWATRPLGAATATAPARLAARATTGSPTAAPAGATAPVMPMSAGAGTARDTSRGPRVGARRTRKARLRLARIDPWSVMKTTFLFSIAFGVMLIVIVSVLWSVIAASGALEALNQFLTTLVGDQTGGEFRIETFVSGSRILGFAALLAAIDVVIITAVSTLFAFLYNLAATVMGGLEVTLAED